MKPVCCTWIGVAAIAITLGACSRREPAREREATRPAPPRDAALAATPDANPDAALAWYRVVASIDDKGGRVPFVIGVHRERPEGIVYSADERLPLVLTQRTPLVLRIPVRGVELALTPDGDAGTLRGTWRVSYFFKRDFDIVAEPIAAPTPALLFPGDEPPAIDLTGTWRIDIHDFGVGRAIFRQDPAGTLTGTVIPPEVGDLRHLTGRVLGTRAQLSVFDGIHGFLLEMSARDDGTLQGRWLIAGIGTFPFTATREAAPATHLAVKARLAPGKTRVSIPQLARAPYAGNPVIVDYFGSWCPVCMDLTPELVRLRQQHAAAGLQILSIALEPEGDEAETRRRLEEFRTTFGVTWPFEIEFADDFFAQLPRELVDATGFPVTIFVRRDGTVAGVHTGFVSRAAGDEHAAVVKRFDELAAEIAASPPAAR